MHKELFEILISNRVINRRDQLDQRAVAASSVSAFNESPGVSPSENV